MLVDQLKADKKYEGKIIGVYRLWVENKEKRMT